jgi:hypothetical protein
MPDWTAVATFALAILTACAVGTSIILARGDRRAAEALIASESASIAQRDERTRTIGMLVALGRAYGESEAYPSAPQATAASQEMHLLATALPRGFATTMRSALRLPGHDNDPETITGYNLLRSSGAFIDLPDWGTAEARDKGQMAQWFPLELAANIRQVEAEASA